MAKDANRPVATLISESHEEVVFTGDLTRGKGTPIPDNEVMAYPEIPDVAHEFAARLQFGTTFELMEFLAQQQITLSERMVEEHADMQMISGRWRAPRNVRMDAPSIKLGECGMRMREESASNFPL